MASGVHRVKALSHMLNTNGNNIVWALDRLQNQDKGFLKFVPLHGQKRQDGLLQYVKDSVILW